MTTTRRTFLSRGAAASVAATLFPISMLSESIPSSVADSLGAPAARSIKSGACPGVAISLTHKGIPLFQGGFGLANLETYSPVTEASVFRIGSLTKQFTAAAVLKLCSQERLKLNDPVGSYLPSFAHLSPVTLRELLQHTGGLHSSDESEPSVPSIDEKTQLQLAQEIAAQSKVFDFSPGTAWLYSNANYIVLGAVVEQVSKKSLHLAAEELLFYPLSLSATSFDGSADIVLGRASGYSPQAGLKPPYIHAPYIPIAEGGGAGAMRSTVGDLCRWHQALLAARLFPIQFVEIMMTPGRLRDGSLSGSKRFSSNDAGMGETQYGMGLLLPPPVESHHSILHYGAIEGFASCLETYVDMDLTLAVLCNADNGPDLPFRAIRKIVREEVVPTLRS